MAAERAKTGTGTAEMPPESAEMGWETVETTPGSAEMRPESVETAKESAEMAIGAAKVPPGNPRRDLGRRKWDFCAWKSDRGMRQPPNK